MKKILSLLVIFISALALSGCHLFIENAYPYRGEYIELYTTAIYSIPDSYGRMDHGEGAFTADIHVWEQDDYGRTLFSYCEDYDNEVFGLIICQGYDETNVHFYSDSNYVLTLMESDHLYSTLDEDYLKNRTHAFYLENKDKLKAENDWNQPIDKSKCVFYPVTDHKILDEDLFSFSSSQCDYILNEYTKTLNLTNPNKRPHRYNRVLQVDAEGKILHQIYGIHQYHDYPNKSVTEKYTSYSIVLWVITDKDGNYDPENGILVMLSKENSSTTFVYDSDKIQEFKYRNDWKYSN